MIIENKLNNIFDKNFFSLIFRESILILLLFALTILVVYALPKIVGYFFIIGIIGIFWISKKDYFWFAYFFIIICSPGNFFSEGGLTDAPYRLPLFSLASSFSFSTHDMFLLFALLKAFTKGKKYNYILSKPLILILFYIIFLLAISILFYETSITRLVDLLRNTAYFLVFISFPYLVRKKEDIYKFIYLTFPIIFFMFFTSIFFFISGRSFLYLFNPNSLREMTLETGGGMRLGLFGGGHIILLFTFIFSLVLSIINREKNCLYLYLIAIMSYISVFMTSTRIWFVVFTLILIIFIFKLKKGKSLWSFGSILIIMIVALSFNTKLSEGVSYSWNRISTIFTLGKEDSYSTRSIESKINSDMPIILKGIKQNPITGWGYSDKYLAHGSDDVGNWNLIYQVGLIGFFLFIYLWFKYFILIYTTKRKLLNNNELKNVFSILSVSFWALLLAHFTTHQVFGPTMQSYNNYFLALFIFFSEFFVRQSFQYPNSIHKVLNNAKVRSN